MIEISIISRRNNYQNAYQQIVNKKSREPFKCPPTNTNNHTLILLHSLVEAVSPQSGGSGERHGRHHGDRQGGPHRQQLIIGDMKYIFYGSDSSYKLSEINI